MPAEQRPHGELVAVRDPPDQHFIGGAFNCCRCTISKCGSRSRMGVNHTHEASPVITSRPTNPPPRKRFQLSLLINRLLKYCRALAATVKRGLLFPISHFPPAFLATRNRAPNGAARRYSPETSRSESRSPGTESGGTNP